MADTKPPPPPHQVEGDRPGETSAILTPLNRKRSYASESSESGLVVTSPPKRPRQGSEMEGTLELSELYSVIVEDDESDQQQPVVDQHPSAEDVKFMREAEAVSLNSKDESTKVGAIIVDPKTKEVLGEGWNRMPKGCEERFPMSKGDRNILKTKYPFVLHGVRATIVDDLKKHPGDRLDGTTLYCTLIPDHNDSQMIREVGISKVIYRDDKFPKYAFTKAAKKILQGLEVRKIEMPAIQQAPTDSDSD